MLLTRGKTYPNVKKRIFSQSPTKPQQNLHTNTCQLVRFELKSARAFYNSIAFKTLNRSPFYPKFF